jgi:hypothetical protein
MPPCSAYRIITALDRADLKDRQTEISTPAWPEFMLHDPVSRGWSELYEHFPEFQFALEDPAGGLVAVGNSLPLAFDGGPEELPDEGWDWAFQRGLEDHAARRRPGVVCALQVVVALGHQGKGISAQAVSAMKSIGCARGLPRLIVPARPTWKSRYPLVPMARYITWTDGGGLPFDPWLRVHARLGGRIAKVCPRSMRIGGTVGEWEGWTGRTFPESGRYVAPGALVPIEIDRRADRGTYVEPNVWVVHALAG